jgi:hypothetical protein
MNLVSRISEHFIDSAQTKLSSTEILAAPIADAVEMMVSSLMATGKILACGNGGSAADAQHFAAELVGRYERERPELAAIALTVDTLHPDRHRQRLRLRADLRQAGARTRATARCAARAVHLRQLG